MAAGNLEAYASLALASVAPILATYSQELSATQLSNATDAVQTLVDLTQYDFGLLPSKPSERAQSPFLEPTASSAQTGVCSSGATSCLLAGWLALPRIARRHVVVDADPRRHPAQPAGVLPGRRPPHQVRRAAPGIARRACTFIARSPSALSRALTAVPAGARDQHEALCPHVVCSQGAWDSLRGVAVPQWKRAAAAQIVSDATLSRNPPSGQKPVPYQDYFALAWARCAPSQTSGDAAAKGAHGRWQRAA